MKVILKIDVNKNHPFEPKHFIFKPKKQTQLTDVLRELWEKEYNAWDGDPDRESSWFEEDHAVIDDEIRNVEFIVTNVVEVEL